MNILIVDDEYYIVQGILQNTDWEKLGIENTYSAYSMNQAIEIFQNHPIHILLTDIEMPKYSGLDLIEWVNDHNYHPIKVLLTGHENFSYAQRAIHLGCKQYLVKPIHPQKLQASLSEAIASYKEQYDLEKASRLAASWDDDPAKKYPLFWSEIISSKTPLEDLALFNLLDRYNLPAGWAKKPFHLLLLVRYKHPEFEENTSSHEQNFMDLLVNYKGIDPNLLHRLSSNQILIILQDDDFSSADLLQQLRNYCPHSKYLLLITETLHLQAFASLHDQMQNFIRKVFIKESLCLPFNKENLPKNLDSTKPNFDQWSDWILRKQESKILQEIQQLFPSTTTLYSLKDLESIYQGLLYSVLKAFEKSSVNSEDFLEHQQPFFEKEKIQESSPFFNTFVKKELEKAVAFIQERSETNPFLTTIKDYIKENIASEDLNRNTLAEIVHMNPDYVSYLFHKLTKEHLSSYITNKRIEAAKKLLLSGSYSLQEISDRVGFANSSYFHRQFKKVVGMTPQQFRSRD